jgi:hypothetical protein
LVTSPWDTAWHYEVTYVGVANIFFNPNKTKFWLKIKENKINPFIFIHKAWKSDLGT